MGRHGVRALGDYSIKKLLIARRPKNVSPFSLFCLDITFIIKEFVIRKRRSHAKKLESERREKRRKTNNDQYMGKRERKPCVRCHEHKKQTKTETVLKLERNRKG